MTIQEFFEMSAGKWFSQRTSHILADRESDQQKSEIVIELLAADRPEAIALCQQQGIAPSWGIRVVGKGLPDWNAPKNVQLKNSMAVLVPIPDSNQLLCSLGGELLTGTFAVAADDSVNLLLEGKNFSLDERIWFASPNLRMRTTVHKGADGLQIASFCSEIKMMAEAPKEVSATSPSP
jgi:CpeS-like protein